MNKAIVSTVRIYIPAIVIVLASSSTRLSSRQTPLRQGGST
ncbi:MAG: hypothetical protein WCK53_08140 [Methanomicrobiales archaeon]